MNKEAGPLGISDLGQAKFRPSDHTCYSLAQPDPSSSCETAHSRDAAVFVV